MGTERKLLRVAISHGDINGINYELFLKLFDDERILELFTPIMYASRKALNFWIERLQIESKTKWVDIKNAKEAKDGVVNLIDVTAQCCTHSWQVEVGKPTNIAGELAFWALERATADVLSGLADILVTAPINKGVMPRDRFPYSGHTQYLEDKAAIEPGKSLMLLCAHDCRVALATDHIPISEVSSNLTLERIVEKVQTMEAGLIRDFGITKPRIAVLALNPHAGDNGLIGDEEESIIRPAIQVLNEERHIVFGPYPADGFWGSHASESFDGVLAMYHDQGLTPFKTLYMSDGVNTTMGLRIVRTSPDHGTGYDIAAKGIASAESLRQAIYLGIDIYRARQRHDEASRNPLRRVYFNKGRDDEKIDFTHSEDQY